MTRDTRRSGVSLILVGMAGCAFFVLTDPRWSPFRGDASPTVIDAIRQAGPGTLVGLVGSAVVALIGLWLITRRVA